MFSNSVCSYPDRGPYGNNRYRGNCTGHIIRDFIESYISGHNRLFSDPSIGGGTSQEVAECMNVRFKGTDLHQGFNLLTDDFAEYLGEEANLIWWHPPYWDMIAYSGNQWGEPNKWDMSRMGLEQFAQSLELSLMNIHDACEKKGHYGVLMGNLRRQGSYYNLSSLVERVSPGRLVDEIIKVQHNCTSDSSRYRGKLVRIAHEKLLVFRKDSNSSLIIIGTAFQRSANLMLSTWKAAVRRVLQGGKTLTLDQIYTAIEPFANQRNNQHWKAKVRQIVQDDQFFERVDRGTYTLAH